MGIFYIFGENLTIFWRKYEHFWPWETAESWRQIARKNHHDNPIIKIKMIGQRKEKINNF